MEKIILLDLNYTLAQKTGMNLDTFSYDVSKDEYRMDLVEAIRGKRIFLITARTDNYEKSTREKIKIDTGLEIERFYFKPYSERFVPVHEFKQTVAKKLILEGISPNNMFGIESNEITRKKYAEIGIDSLCYADYMKKVGNL